MKFKAAWNPNLIAFYIESLSGLNIKIKDIGVASYNNGMYDGPNSFFIEVGDLTVEQVKAIGIKPSHCFEMTQNIWQWAVYTQELQIATLRAEHRGVKTKPFFENLEKELTSIQLRRPIDK